jgi:hypothetical protein
VTKNESWQIVHPGNRYSSGAVHLFHQMLKRFDTPAPAETAAMTDQITGYYCDAMSRQPSRSAVKPGAVVP